MRTPARRATAAFAALAALAALGLAAADGALAAKAKLVEVGRFDRPVYAAGPPGDPARLVVAGKTGLISIVRDGRTLDAPFLDLRTEVNATGYEQGLQSVAFAPDYATSGRLYVFYNDRTGDIRVREYRRSDATPDRTDPNSARNILRIGHRRFTNHNGGQLQFGPDELLYVSTGDGGGVGNPLRSAQSRGSLLGKILRIDPRKSEGGRPYAIPKTNPFRSTSGARGEIYAYGLRNPYRFSFDRSTGDLAIGDVGQNEVEEIDFVRRGKGRGANFGWNCFEGRKRFSSCNAAGHVKPVIERSHGAGECSITGGYVVRDHLLKALKGQYVYGDFCRDDLRVARLGGGRAKSDARLGLKVPALAGFGEDASGRIYAVSFGGAVYRLAAP